MTTAAPKAATKAKAPAANFAEIQELVAHVLPPFEGVTAGGDSLGNLAPVWRWLAACQGKPRPDIRHPRIALFAAGHGFAPEQSDATRAALQQLAAGKHALTAVAVEGNADLQVYELNLDAPSGGDRSGSPALDEASAAHAISYGLMAVQPGIDLLCLAALNPAADVAGEKIVSAIKDGMKPLAALTSFGGLDICAMTGAIAAARLARMPVLLDGGAAKAAAAVLTALRADAAEHARDAGDLMAGEHKAAPGMAGALTLTFLKSLAKAF